MVTFFLTLFFKADFNVSRNLLPPDLGVLEGDSYYYSDVSSISPFFIKTFFLRAEPILDNGLESSFLTDFFYLDEADFVKVFFFLKESIFSV